MPTDSLTRWPDGLSRSKLALTGEGEEMKLEVITATVTCMMATEASGEFHSRTP